MEGRYDKCRQAWDNVFSNGVPDAPESLSSGNETIDKGIKWISEGTEKILDFGSGSGTMLFLCALNGTKHHMGVDLSENAIALADKRKESMKSGEFSFKQGGIETLEYIENSYFDGVILSNIIDNLYPEDAELLLYEIRRVLKKNGKILVKLNPYITADKIKEWNIEVIEGNLLDDGLILWNNTTEEWTNFFKKNFQIKHYEEVYYPEHKQYNRMFWLEK